MTKSRQARCDWCGERFTAPAGPGRPQAYCRRSHRQRAYEARRLGADRGLEQGEMLLSSTEWASARDAHYLLEAAARDAETDLVDDPDSRELRDVVRALVGAIDHVIASFPEPKAVGGG